MVLTSSTYVQANQEHVKNRTETSRSVTMDRDDNDDDGNDDAISVRLQQEWTTVNGQSMIPCGEKTYALPNVDGERVDVFTPDATYAHNGVEYSRPPSFLSVWQRIAGDEIITYTTDPRDEGNADVVDRVVVYRPGALRDQDERVTECWRTDGGGSRENGGNGVYATVVDGEDWVNVTDVKSTQAFFFSTNQHNECDSFRQVDLAVAYESTFCAQYNNDRDRADQAVVLLVELVSQRYRQVGLCVALRLSRLEGHCDDDADPYAQGNLVSEQGPVDTEHSGCQEINGLLDGFRHYWNAERTHVRRDVAHLFTGTPLVRDHTSSSIGCASQGTVCDHDSAYGIDYVTYTDWVKYRVTLVAHELGHNLGARHAVDDDDGRSYIMHPRRYNGGRNGFGSLAVRDITERLDQVDCVGWTSTDNGANTVLNGSADEDDGASECRYPFRSLYKFGPFTLLFFLIPTLQRRRSNRCCGCHRKEETDPEQSIFNVDTVVWPVPAVPRVTDTESLILDDRVEETIPAAFALVQAVPVTDTKK